MKKLLFVLFVLGISLQSHAALKEKDVVGTWKYKVETDEGTLTGTFTIENKDGKLVGEVNTDDGEIISMSNVQLKDNDILYFEVDTGYESLVASVTVKGKAFEGTVGNDLGAFPFTGEKVE
jgi:hypothetical protein